MFFYATVIRYIWPGYFTALHFQGKIKKYTNFMKAFITGATGFIGSHLADTLLNDDNNEIRCLVRSGHKWLTGKPVNIIKGDLHSLDALKEGMQGVDVVFHLAAIVKAPSKNIFTRNNVDATENVIRTAQRLGVKKIVILSSLAATGPSFSRPVTETDPLMPVSMYGESKKEMEEMLKRVVRDEDSVTVLRPPAVYGPREDQIFSVFKAASNGIFPIIGDGDLTRLSLVHVQDVVQGLLLAAKNNQPHINTYFISSEKTYTWNEIKAATAHALGKRIYSIPINPGLVKKISGIIEDIASVIGKYPVINREKAAELVLEWTCSVDKAKNELGYSQKVSLEDGINQTIDWYKVHNWL